MKGKVTCPSCGWSWNKSDSSQKDMHVCHNCGKSDVNMKNGGWLDQYADGGTMQEYQENYNDSQVSAPEGFEGEGYSNKGRNYSPAWGGQFQMGGSVYPVNYVSQAQMGASIPGAVGFSYARTQSPAPSNGPYAKKTKASAQNGQEMEYYKNGLDWKPKSISKNGGWLNSYENGGVIDSDRGQWDYPGEITRIKGSKITMKKDPKTGKALTEPLLGISNTGQRKMMYPGQDYQFEEGTENVTEIPKSKLAKNGLRQEQKGLQNLDNLINFTNYNKPQPGGWLNKYN